MGAALSSITTCDRGRAATSNTKFALRFLKATHIRSILSSSYLLRLSERRHRLNDSPAESAAAEAGFRIACRRLRRSEDSLDRMWDAGAIPNLAHAADTSTAAVRRCDTRRVVLYGVDDCFHLYPFLVDRQDRSFSVSI